ncbi:grasp-with-spasm system ATP-grasp peptide maturase [Dinghuibacter silviterrae]|uniref:ATP-GRASP peptide maturase of grasp-with-spasm system n=1 Tax=Dinghuibacter silviterrae TaxID=1539049 RepID=A0A4R8DH00_9BACT|nr:grasp-with-spasm system ATP-grasp peptide maturase [Dinghuibacter silviterrae]TDW96963.1 ATP-GRASP peptide maturase of grasp-with-spasm system [Dinghuibacter silviterrae]
MILILSSPTDHSTNRVSEWITRLGGHYIRLNDTLLYNADTPFDYGYRNGTEDVGLTVSGYSFRLSDIHIVWYRRWTSRDYLRGLHELTENKEWASNLVRHISVEIQTAGQFFLHLLRHKQWLDPPKATGAVRKHEVLTMAVEEGLLIPNTLVTNHRERAQSFLLENRRIVSKPLSEITFYNSDDFEFLCYTREIAEEDLLKLPAFFYPTLFQQLIERKLEIRTFYLDGECFSMAIFSGEGSKMDFRDLDMNRPVRMAPYRLPQPVEASIRRLMDRLGLSTGSLDLMLSTEGRLYFLEVNPVGQFGMTSYPCNYQLDKKIAEYLIAHDQ